MLPPDSQHDNNIRICLLDRIKLGPVISLAFSYLYALTRPLNFVLNCSQDDAKSCFDKRSCLVKFFPWQADFCITLKVIAAITLKHIFRLAD